MLGGFALVATPARYGASGIMTFIVNHDGEVYQKDLGPRTGNLAPRIFAATAEKTPQQKAAEEKSVEINPKSFPALKNLAVLYEKAGFKHVPEPVPMRNSNESELYYLFFASNNAAGDRIAKGIFKHYR